MLSSLNTLLVVIVIGFLVLYWYLAPHFICPDNPYGKKKPTTGGHVLWSCEYADSFADGYVTACNGDLFYKVSLLVECLLERAVNELPEGYTLFANTLKAQLVLFHKGQEVCVYSFMGLDSIGIVPLLDSINLTAALHDKKISLGSVT